MNHFRYRAEIVATQVNKTMPHELLYDVYFLDYGDSQFISKKDILELRTDFLSLRFQAIECFLAHVQPCNGGNNMDEWDEKTVEAFEQMVQAARWKKMRSKIVTYKERKSFAFQRQSKQRESSPIPGVELYDSENASKNISLELVKLGLAELIDPFGDLSKSSILNSTPEDLKKTLPVSTEKKVVEDPKTNAVTNGSKDEPNQKINGNTSKQPSSAEQNIFSPEKPGKSTNQKQQISDFLQNEQQSSTVDWNAMLLED